MYARQKAPAVQATPSIDAPFLTTGPAMEPAGGDFTAQFSTSGHRNVGDSVEGASVDVNGVSFTPGEINALVDYVGSVDELFAYPPAVLLQMKGMIANGVEDAKTWDGLTNGGYSKLAQDNECHFAPSASGGGADFRSTFIALHAEALGLMRRAEAQPDAPEHDDLVARARATAYSAEHFLEDAFSAGHQVGGGDVESAVDDAMEGVLASLPALTLGVGALVWLEHSETIQCYGTLTGGPLSSAEFMELALAGSAIQGMSGVYDAVRKTVHEDLGAGGVEVASKAHPEPWMLPGDGDLASSPETYTAIQKALSQARLQLEHELAPGVDPTVTATAFFDLHAPTPTSAGRAKVAASLAENTKDFQALVMAVATAMGMEITAVLDAVCSQSGGFVRRLREPPSGGHEHEPERGIPDLVKPGGFGASVIYPGRGA